MSYIIIANFGNDSTALIQWAYERKLADVLVVSFDTGWSAPEWDQRLQQADAWLADLGFCHVRLKPQLSFAELVAARGEFPTSETKWCASMLKGLPLLTWLDQKQDPNSEAIIMLALRRGTSLVREVLAEHDAASEYYGGRSVWRPLYNYSDQQRDRLVQQAGFALLGYRSLECDPCVCSDRNDLLRVEQSVLARTAQLEQEMHSQLADDSYYQDQETILDVVDRWQQDNQQFHSYDALDLFDLGCGNPYACGT